MKLKRNAADCKICHKNNILSRLAFLLFFLSAFNAAAQTTPTQPQINPAAAPEFPQWAKDIRRWEIVAFGSFPFTILTATMAVDTKRWIDANNMDWTEEGRKYAPWPLKSAGAEAMSREEQVQTVLLAAGISAAVAFTDFAIIQIKRNKERRRIESLPTGATTITTQPWPSAEDTPDDVLPSGGDDAEAGTENPVP